jgi:hypothetical protein
MTENHPSIDRRTALKALSVTGAIGLAGCTVNLTGSQSTETPSPSDNTETQEFEDDPRIEIPVIDAYHNGEKVWFIHTSASSKKMAGRLTGMIGYPTLHAPKLDEIVDLDALEAIYVFKNGIDRSDAEPWSGGPFGFQIDVLGSVPDDQAYTPLRRPHVVTWAEDADARILRSVKELMAARDAGELEISPTDVVVTAPVVSWPGDPFGDGSEINENSG